MKVNMPLNKDTKPNKRIDLQDKLTAIVTHTLYIYARSFQHSLKKFNN